MYKFNKRESIPKLEVTEGRDLKVKYNFGYTVLCLVGKLLYLLNLYKIISHGVRKHRVWMTCENNS